MYVIDENIQIYIPSFNYSIIFLSIFFFDTAKISRRSIVKFFPSHLALCSVFTRTFFFATSKNQLGFAKLAFRLGFFILLYFLLRIKDKGQRGRSGRSEKEIEILHQIRVYVQKGLICIRRGSGRLCILHLSSLILYNFFITIRTIVCMYIHVKPKPHIYTHTHLYP